MRPHRYLKPKNAGCPQWILEGVREIHDQAIARDNQPTEKSPYKDKCESEEKTNDTRTIS